MNNINTIIIDIREEFELLEKQIVSIESSLLIINIPMRTIFANILWINKISKINKIYIVCNSGNRSKNIKKTYFNKNKNILSINGGIEKLKLHKLFKNKIKLILGKGGIGLQQYIQISFVCMLTFILLLLYFNIDKKYVIGIISSFILFIYYQVYSKGCLISSLIPLSDFLIIKN